MGRVLVLGCAALAFLNAQSSAPYYTEASIANTAASIADFYAPNTFVTVYGLNLANATGSITSDDLAAGMLPTALPGTEVRVLINQIPADLWYCSPTQINLLVPNYLAAGPATLQIEVNGRAGPAIQIVLGAVAPALYQTDLTTVLAVHLDGTMANAASPAQPGEVVVLYATGLGPTLPPGLPNQIPQVAAPLAMPGVQIWLNGTPVDPSLILYAGVAPGYAGLYQINFQLPASAPANPEIRIGWSSQMSPAQRFLPVE